MILHSVFFLLSLVTYVIILSDSWILQDYRDNVNTNCVYHISLVKRETGLTTYLGYRC